MRKFSTICTLIVVICCLVIKIIVHEGNGSIKPFNEPDYPKKIIVNHIN